MHVELPHFPKPSGSEERHDGMLFPGFVMIVLAAIGTVSARRDVAALYLTLASIGFVLSLGPEATVWGHTLATAGPYAWLLEAAPILDGLRVPARLAILVYLGLSVLASFGAAALLAGRSARARSIVCSLLVAFVLFEGYGAVPMVEIGRRGRTRDNGLYAWLARQPAAAVLELPIARLDNDYRGFIYQYNTLVHEHPLVNGWTGYSTDLQQWLGDAASPLRNSALAADGLDLLRGLGVGYVARAARHSRCTIEVDGPASIRIGVCVHAGVVCADRAGATARRDRSGHDPRVGIACQRGHREPVRRRSQDTLDDW